MIKDFTFLVKTLFKSKPKDKECVTLIGLKHFPFKGYKFLMWCGYMIYRLDNEDNIGKEMLTNRFEISKTHETIHLAQAKMYDSWVRYYLAYLWEWIRRGILAPMTANYYVSKFESEAYANEGNFDYCANYDGKGIVKYKIKNAKKLYKQLGGTSKAWKEYIKTL